MGIVGGLAHWQAEAGDELLDITVGDLLDQQADAFPDREFLVYRYPEIGLDLRLTYAGMKQRVDEFAKGLIALGIGPGDKVGILATNVPEWFIADFALPRIGAVLVTINTNSRREELSYLMALSEMKAIILIDRYRDIDYLAELRGLIPDIETNQNIDNADFPRFRFAIQIGGRATRGSLIAWDEVFERGATIGHDALRQRQAAVTPDDVWQIQFTSGTTGASKGAMLTHRSTVNNAYIFGLRMGMQAGDRLVSCMPLFHTAGNVLETLGMLVHGGTIIKAIHFEALKMLELIDKERPTILSAVPTMLIAMMREQRFEAGEFDTGSLRILIAGGTPMPVPVLEQVKKRLGADPMVGFGMTEASPMVTGTFRTDSFETRSTTVGKPLPWIDVKVVDTDGRTVKIGESGEFLIRGFGVMAGYYRMPDKTAEAIDQDGWLHSGDLASIDAEGYVRIVGRIKDMFIRGGENVYPAEVENFLMKHPQISQAQVVGVPDEYMGEEGAAFLQYKAGHSPTAEELRDYCKAGMARHKLPKYFVAVESYPVTPSGKVKKFELRSAFIESRKTGAT